MFSPILATSCATPLLEDRAVAAGVTARTASIAVSAAGVKATAATSSAKAAKSRFARHEVGLAVDLDQHA
jgi:hypothetical protein